MGEDILLSLQVNKEKHFDVIRIYIRGWGCALIFTS